MNGLLTMILIIVIFIVVVTVGVFIADSHLRKKTKQPK